MFVVTIAQKCQRFQFSFIRFPGLNNLKSHDFDFIELTETKLEKAFQAVCSCESPLNDKTKLVIFDWKICSGVSEVMV